MGATKKMCTFFQKRENGAKSYFRNFPNDPKCLDSEIIKWKILPSFYLRGFERI